MAFKSMHTSPAAAGLSPHPLACCLSGARAIGASEREWAEGRGLLVCAPAAALPGLGLTGALAHGTDALAVFSPLPLHSRPLLHAYSPGTHASPPPFGTTPAALPPHFARLTYERDVKVENAGTLTIEREDHTLGNLVRMQLLRDPRVTYVAYKQPHPLEHNIILRVHTQLGPRGGGAGGGGAGDALGMGGGGAAGGGDAAAPYLPTDAIATALRDLNAEINLIADKLDAALDAAATTMDDHGQYR